MALWVVWVGVFFGLAGIEPNSFSGTVNSSPFTTTFESPDAKTIGLIVAIFEGKHTNTT